MTARIIRHLGSQNSNPYSGEQACDFGLTTESNIRWHKSANDCPRMLQAISSWMEPALIAMRADKLRLQFFTTTEASPASTISHKTRAS